MDKLHANGEGNLPLGNPAYAGFIYKLRVPDLNAGRSSVAAVFRGTMLIKFTPTIIRSTPLPHIHPHYILRALSYLYLSYHPIPIFFSAEFS